MNSTSPARRGGPAVAVLAAAMAVWLVLASVWAGDRIFALDEWSWAIGRNQWNVDSILSPYNGHLVALPMIAFKGVLSVFGAGSHLPFTLLGFSVHLLTAGLIYVLAARRLGAWVSLMPAALILFYGAGWEVSLNTAGLVNEMGIAFGLAAFVALERRDRAGDIAAALLLLASVASFSVGVAFAAGAAVRIVVESHRDGGTGAATPWRGRIWIVAAPIAVYAIWFAWAHAHYDVEGTTLGDDSIFSGVFDQLKAITAGLTGLFRFGGTGEFPGNLIVRTDYALIPTLVLLGLVVWLLVRARRPTPAQIGVLVTLAVYIALVAVALSEARAPESSRYVYMGSVLVVLVLCELFGGVEIRTRWVAVAGVLLAASLVANVGEMRIGGEFFERESAINKADLTTLELERARVDPNLVPEPSPMGLFPHTDLNFRAGDYFAFIDQHGSPGGDPDELPSKPVEVREAADAMLAYAGVIVVAPDAVVGASGNPPKVITSGNADVATAGSCLKVTATDPSHPASVTVEPSSSATFEAKDGPASVLAGRFSAVLRVPVSADARSGSIALPVDDSSVPWRVGFALPGGGKICGVESGG